MKSILIVLCALFSGTLSGKSNDHPDTSNYLEYYHAVATAEEAVVNADYTAAVTQYRNAFAGYPYNNPIDCYVAAQTAAYIGDMTVCSDFLYKGLSFGLPAQTIAGNPHLTPCFNSLPTRSVDSCRKVYQQRIDQPARAKLLSLIRHDVDIRRNLSRREKFYDYSSSSRGLMPEYQPIWDSLINEVISLIRSSGFPAQKVIGTQDGKEASFPASPNSSYVAFIFIHHCNAWPLVKDLMWNELQKGNITPKMYGVIYESSNGRRDYQDSVYYFASRPCFQRACRSMVDNHLREIDAARWSIGLEKYEVMDKKFVSRAHYYKWIKAGARTKEPFFDFQCDLSFQ